jgi:hypothetical protein
MDLQSLPFQGLTSSRSEEASGLTSQYVCRKHSCAMACAYLVVALNCVIVSAVLWSLHSQKGNHDYKIDEVGALKDCDLTRAEFLTPSEAVQRWALSDIEAMSLRRRNCSTSGRAKK